jgi:hypothetical protein
VPGACALEEAVPVDCCCEDDCDVELTSGLVLDGVEADELLELCGIELLEDEGLVELCGIELLEDEDGEALLDGFCSAFPVAALDGFEVEEDDGMLLEDEVLELGVLLEAADGFEAEELEFGMLLEADGLCASVLVVELVEDCELALLLGEELAPAFAAIPLCEASPAALPGLPGVALALPLTPAASGVLLEADALALTVRCSWTFFTPGMAFARRFASFLSSFFATEPSSVTTPSFTVICTFCRSGLEASCSWTCRCSDSSSVLVDCALMSLFLSFLSFLCFPIADASSCEVVLVWSCEFGEELIWPEVELEFGELEVVLELLLVWAAATAAVSASTNNIIIRRFLIRGSPVGSEFRFARCSVPPLTNTPWALIGTP